MLHIYKTIAVEKLTGRQMMLNIHKSQWTANLSSSMAGESIEKSSTDVLQNHKTGQSQKDSTSHTEPCCKPKYRPVTYERAK
jgi:hypothetical protein